MHTKFERWWTPKSGDRGSRVHPYVYWIRECCDTVELECRQCIINTPLHLAWHLKGIFGNEHFWLEEHRKMVGGYEGIPGQDKPHKLHGSMNAWQGCARPRAWKESVGISNNAMCASTPGSAQYIPLCSVHLCYPCISVCIYINRLRWYMPYCNVWNLVTVTKTNTINKMPSGCGTLRTTTVRMQHSPSCTAAQ